MKERRVPMCGGYSRQIRGVKINGTMRNMLQRVANSPRGTMSRKDFSSQDGKYQQIHGVSPSDP